MGLTERGFVNVHHGFGMFAQVVQGQGFAM
jgi:hypothetical protein